MFEIKAPSIISINQMFSFINESALPGLIRKASHARFIAATRTRVELSSLMSPSVPYVLAPEPVTRGIGTVQLSPAVATSGMGTHLDVRASSPLFRMFPNIIKYIQNVMMQSRCASEAVSNRVSKWK